MTKKVCAAVLELPADDPKFTGGVGEVKKRAGARSGHGRPCGDRPMTSVREITSTALKSAGLPPSPDPIENTKRCVYALQLAVERSG